MVKSLPNAELVSLTLQDHNYDRRLMTHGLLPRPSWLGKTLLRAYRSLKRRTGMSYQVMDLIANRYTAIDQTKESALAQIQCIIKKLA